MSSSPLLGGSATQVEVDDWEAHVEVSNLPGRASTRRQCNEGAFWLGAPVAAGLILGLVLPVSDFLPSPFNRLSSLIGWVYFCAWSISFYPQAFLNYRRKSVVGLSLDFQLLNLLGFGCYAVYNAALYWSSEVRGQYACLHDGAMPAVHANDLFFALHAAAITTVTLVQCAIYDRGGQRISWPAALGTGGALAAAGSYLAAVVAAARDGRGGGGDLAAGPLPCGDVLSWLSFFYFLSYIKLVVSLVKYLPQVYLNYKRQSTEGWNVHNVLLDFGGGLLSLVQLLMDGAVSRNWTAVTGNPVKFALGFTSMFFDLIFMAQHWLLYPAAAATAAAARKLPGCAPSDAAAAAKAGAAAEALEGAAVGQNVASSFAALPPASEAAAARGSSSREILAEQQQGQQQHLDEQRLLHSSLSRP